MELLSLDSSDLFFIFVAFIAFIAFLKSLKSPIITIAQGRVPPGPPKLPVIGNLHQLKSPPHRSLAELASKHGPIMRLQLGQLTTTVISSADLARDILTTHDVTFANRPITAGNRILSYGLLDIGFAPYGPYWRQLRKICKSDLLSSGRVGSFRKIREDEAAKLVREIAEEAQGNEGVNLSKKLSGMTYGIALSSAFGRNCKAREDYIAIVHRIFKMMTGFTLVNLFPGVKLLERATGMKPKLMKLHGEKDGIVQRILDDHKQRLQQRKKNIRGDGNEEDLTDVLLRFQEPGDLVFVDKNGVMKAKCKYCRKILGGDTSNGTSHLRNNKKVCVQKQIHDGSQKNLAVNFLSNGAVGKKELCSGQFNNEVSRKQLATMIVMHEYSLGIVDHLYFKIFCNGLQPLFKVPSRNTTKKDIFAMYEVEKKKIQRVIDGNKGRIAITTDMWTATNQKRGYMAITGHYIDNHDILRGHLLSFPYVPAPHSSEKLATVLHDCLMSWNVDCKLSTITLDNCSTNDALIDKMKRKLVLSDLLLNGSLLQMRCSAHILNLIVKDGLDIIKSGIERIRDSVSYWTATPKRIEFFEECAKQRNVDVGRKLALDCPTRWNSTFKMLESALPYKDVFSRLTKFSKYWTDIHLLLTVAVVLDPAYKFELIDYYWVKFGCSDSSLEPDNVKASVYNLVREYQLKKQIRDKISLDNAGSSNGAGSDSRISEADLDYEIYLSRRKRVKTNSVCSELDHYLSEDVSPRAPNVSVLDWWRVNTGKYPLLQEVARDLLAVPVTYVASDFSVKLTNSQSLLLRSLPHILSIIPDRRRQLHTTCSPEFLSLISTDPAGLLRDGYSSSLCLEGSLDLKLVKGKIVMCDRGINSRADRGISYRDERSSFIPEHEPENDG
ncbi:Cytochrome P450 71D11 (Fragment) [Linum grandiflorum]